MQQHCRSVILLGRDAEKIRQALQSTNIPLLLVSDLAEATGQAAALARPGDVVVLAPACASLDMFKNFEERGELFVRAVEGLA